MIDKLQCVRGTKDLLPDDYRIHECIINQAQDIGALYGYQTMSTPIIEHTKVFNRSMGETSDVISKEIYSFLDKSGDAIALRPEFTAGIIRAFILHGLHQQLPLKFFSYGPVFRYDRPQAGRQRQFNQINFEYIGASAPYSDAEVIKLAVDLLAKLKIGDEVTLEINSLGCEESRAAYQKVLIEYLENYKQELSEESQKRLVKNPLRILDSKNENDQKIITDAPFIADSYTASSQKYFIELLNYLDSLNIQYNIQPRLVRGLDYYCHTAFEFTTKKLGAQSTILAGGRYDGLSKIMGGENVPAIGFAAGIERLVLMKEYDLVKPRPIYILPIEENNIAHCFIIADKLRQNDIIAIMETSGKIAKRMQRAISQNAKFIIFIGDNEQANNNLKIKDLDKQEEYVMQFDKAVNIFK